MYRAALSYVAILALTATTHANLIPDPGFETGFVGDPFGAGVGLGDVPDPWEATTSNNHPSLSSPDTHASNGAPGVPVDKTYAAFGGKAFFDGVLPYEGNRFVGAAHNPQELFEPFHTELPQRLSPVRDYTISAQIVASDSVADVYSQSPSLEGGYEVKLGRTAILADAQTVAFLPVNASQYGEWALAEATFTSPFASLQMPYLFLVPTYSGSSPQTRQVLLGIDDLHLDLTPIPEPTTATLLGLTALALTRRTK